MHPFFDLVKLPFSSSSDASERFPVLLFGQSNAVGSLDVRRSIGREEN